MAQAAHAAALSALRTAYPAPRVKTEWVVGCVDALLASAPELTGDPLIAAVRERYLCSDLAHSTLALALAEIADGDALLFQQRTVLQLESITEIGASAFQLQTVLDQRRDVFDGVGRIRRMPDPGQPEPEPEQDNLPPYPRGMLRLVLSDGRSHFRAIEYKPINELKLGETALGSKLSVQNVKALHGMLLLTPDNTQVLYHSVPELQATQARRFAASLRERMGKSPEPEPARSPTPPEHNGPPEILSRFFKLRGRAPAPAAPESDPYDDFEVDDAVLRQIEQVERAGAASRPSPEVIEISSD